MKTISFLMLGTLFKKKFLWNQTEDFVERFDIWDKSLQTENQDISVWKKVNV